MVRPTLISLSAFSDEFAKIAAERSKKLSKTGGQPSGTRTVGTIGGAIGGGALTHKAVKNIKDPRYRALATLPGMIVGGLGGREVGEGAHAAGQGARAMLGTGRAAASNVGYALS